MVAQLAIFAARGYGGPVAPVNEDAALVQAIAEGDRRALAELYERFATDGRVFVEAKPFAIGFRAEHPQSMINAIQYGDRAAKNSKLPPADYKLAENLEVAG